MFSGKVEFLCLSSVKSEKNKFPEKCLKIEIFLFLKVNHLRKRLTKIENDRLSQIGQLSILKGELAMAKCQAIHSASVAKFAEERGRNSSLDEKWKSVPELDETEDFKLEREEISGSLRIKKRRKAIDERDRSIVSEALRRQFTTMKEDRDRKVDEHERIRKEVFLILFFH